MRVLDVHLPRGRMIAWCGPMLLGSLLLLTGCATVRHGESALWPRYELAAEQIVPLELPGGERFDASGLLRTASGELLTVNDRGPMLYRIELSPGGASAQLVPLADCFTPAQLAPLAAAKADRYDCEGIAQDPQARLYLCEEANRWILRCDPRAGTVERLPIDWSPVKRYFSDDPNASFEGIAIGEGKLYVANERSTPVIIVVDLGTGKIVDHFQVYPQTVSLLGTHYSDLCWFEGRLFVLCRQHRVVLQVNPKSHAVLAEYNYRELEDRLGYRKAFPVGLMEGLSVDRDSFWLLTDNNGFGHARAPEDIRPTLVRCPRPERKR